MMHLLYIVTAFRFYYFVIFFSFVRFIAHLYIVCILSHTDVTCSSPNGPLLLYSTQNFRHLSLHFLDSRVADSDLLERHPDHTMASQTRCEAVYVTEAVQMPPHAEYATFRTCPPP